MTIQIPDSIKVDGQLWWVLSTDGAGLPEEAEDFSHVDLGSSFWRGWKSDYVLVDEMLHLSLLMVGARSDRLPHKPILGRPPACAADGTATYRDLGLISYTGWIIAHNVVTRREFMFDAGRLVWTQSLGMHQVPIRSGNARRLLPEPRQPWHVRLIKLLGLERRLAEPTSHDVWLRQTVTSRRD